MLKNLMMPLLEEDTGLEIGTGAEEAEFADQSEEVEEGAEETEFAEPSIDEESDGKTPSDAAFAEMRRKNEELERRLREYDEALSYVFEGEGDDRLIKAKAFGEDKTEEQVRAERELETLRADKERLEEELQEAEIERRMAEDLEAIRKIDPSVKSLVDLDPSFFNLISTGQVSAEDAYFAVKAKAERDKVKTPEPVGRVEEGGDTKDYFTRDEVEAMSRADVKKHYDAIRRSMTKW